MPHPSGELWTWIAWYDDGSSLEEYGPDGDHGFGEIDLRRLRAFELHPADDHQPAFSVLIDPDRGQRPLFFRRRVTGWLLAGGEGSTVLTCIGRQETVHGTNVSTYVFVDDAGHVLIADNPNPVL